MHKKHRLFHDYILIHPTIFLAVRCTLFFFFFGCGFVQEEKPISFGSKLKSFQRLTFSGEKIVNNNFLKMSSASAMCMHFQTFI